MKRPTPSGVLDGHAGSSKWSNTGRQSAFEQLADLIDNGYVSEARDYMELKKGDKSNGACRVRQMLSKYDDKGKFLPKGKPKADAKK